MKTCAERLVQPYTAADEGTAVVCSLMAQALLNGGAAPAAQLGLLDAAQLYSLALW
jgi:hypothetical protein